MSQTFSAKPPLHEHTTASSTTTKLTFYYNDKYDTIIQQFRLQVPQIDISRIRAATSNDDVKRALEDVNSPSGFVLFADYNHAGWMRHFLIPGAPSIRARRFTFGNPLYALQVLQQDIEVALHIPLDCCFIEELKEEGTKLVVTLPTTFVDSGDETEGVRRALAEIEAKLIALIHRLVPPTE